jgi:hypothetical protein
MNRKTHFVPRSDRDFATWADHLATMPTECCGVSESELAAFKAATCDYRAKVTTSNNAQDVARQATFEKQASRRIVEGLGRAMSRRMKTHTDYSKGLGVLLGIEGTPSGHDLSTTAPNLSATNRTGGTVDLQFKKHGSDGVNIYYQRENDNEWILVGRAMVSPFRDIRPLLISGKPEMRSYTAVYMNKDQEVSRYSDDVIITCTP